MAYDVDIQRQGINALFDIQGESDAVAKWLGDELPDLPDKPNSVSHKDDFSLYWIAPQRWLVRADISLEQNLIELLRPEQAADDLSIVLVSDTLKFFNITGADADDIIAIASSIDHHASAFPANGVSYTDIFGIKGLLVRRENGFDIAVESSYADMTADYLERATT